MMGHGNTTGNQSRTSAQVVITPVYRLPHIIDATTLNKVDEKDFLLLPFSNKSTNFTVRNNIHAFLTWAFGVFQDTTVWSSGPIQAISILFEEEFVKVVSRAIVHDSEKANDDKKQSEKQDNKKSANKIGERLEKEAIDKILQFCDNEHAKSTNQLKVIRADDDCYATPDFKPNTGAKKVAPVVGFLTPPYGVHKKRDAVNQLYSPATSRQRTEKWPREKFFAEDYLQKIADLKSKQKILQLFPCHLLTHADNKLYRKSAAAFENLINDKMAEQKFFSAELKNVVKHLAAERLPGEFKKLLRDDKANLLQRLYAKSFGAKQETVETMIKQLIANNSFGLVDLAENSTKTLLTVEIPLFIAAGETAKINFKKTGGVTYFAYPISQSLAAILFGFTDKVLDILVDKDHACYFKWVDTTSKIPTKTKKIDQQAATPLPQKSAPLFQEDIPMPEENLLPQAAIPHDDAKPVWKVSSLLKPTLFTERWQSQRSSDVVADVFRETPSPTRSE